MKIIGLTEFASDRRFIEAIAASLGCQALMSEVIGDLSKEISENKFLALFLSCKQPSDLDGITAFFPEELDLNKVHIIVDDLPNLDLKPYSNLPFCSNVIFRSYEKNGISAEECGTHYSRIVHGSQMKEINGIFDLVKDPSICSSKKITESLQKRFVAEGISSQLQKKSWHPKIAMILANAVDELIMNAIFDAPADQNGEQALGKVSRAIDIQLPVSNGVEIQTAFDGEYLIISVIDQMGTLDRPKLIKHLASNYGNLMTVSRGEGDAGAGLGLSLILKNGASLRFACCPKHKTEVTVFVKKENSYAKFREQFRFISTFVESNN